MIRKRIIWIDYAKAIGIFLVVLGHTYLNEEPNPLLRKIIYTFHMPLFFFLSGCVHKQSSLWNNLFRACRSLLIPALIWNAVWLLGSWIVSGTSFMTVAKGGVLSFLFSKRLPCDVSWFLFALLYCRCMFGLFLDRRYRIVSLCGCALLYAIGLRWNVLYLRPAFWALPFYFGGCFIVANKDKLISALAFQRQSLYFSLVLATAFLATAPLWHGRVSWMVGFFGNPIPYGINIVFSYFIAFVGIFVVCSFCYLWQNVELPLLKEVGTKSLFIMCTHQVVCHRLLGVIPQFEWWSEVVRVIIAVAIVMLIVWLGRAWHIMRFVKRVSA